MERTNGTSKSQHVCVSGSDDHVLAGLRLGATGDGQERLFQASSVTHAGQRLGVAAASPFRDGRQKERWAHIHDLSAFDEFIARF